MSDSISRRDLIRVLGASAAAGGLGSLAPSGAVSAEPAGGGGSRCATVVDGKVIQPQRQLPVLHQTDVLVVGAGPAGVVAALAAKKTGAKVTLVDRYGQLGGQWTGGLVLIVAGVHDNTDRQVTQGVGEEIMRRLDKLDRGVIKRRRGVDPTIDAEATKYVMVEMLREAAIDMFLHCWGVDAIAEGNVVRGAVFESKSGRQAILAKVVVDATGDGDIFAAAGAQYEFMRYHVGLVCRIGNLDKVDRAKAKGVKKPPHLGTPTPIAGVNWVNMHGPEANCLDVAELTRLEMNHRRQIWKNVQRIRETPGYEKVYLVETAPQLGVRMSRLLGGTKKLTLKDATSGRKFPDCIGIGGDWRGKAERLGPWQIPYGVLVPKRVDNLLATGRCVCGEPKLADHLRVIPTCFVTGHAAGVAAALAVADNCPPRDVEVPKLQKILKQQDAYLG